MNKLFLTLFVMSSLAAQVAAAKKDPPKMSEILQQRFDQYKSTFPGFAKSEFDLSVRTYHFTRKIDYYAILAAYSKKYSELSTRATDLIHRSEGIPTKDFPRLYQSQKRLTQLVGRIKNQETGLKKLSKLGEDFCADNALEWSDRFFVPTKLFPVESWDLPQVQSYIPVNASFTYQTNGSQNGGSVNMSSNDEESAAIIGVSAGVGCAIGSVVPIIGNAAGTAIGMAIGYTIVSALAASRAVDEQHAQNDIVDKMRAFSRDTIVEMDRSARNKSREVCSEIFPTSEIAGFKVDLTKLELNASILLKVANESKTKLDQQIASLEQQESKKLLDLSEKYFELRLTAEMAAADQRLSDLKTLDRDASQAWSNVLSKSELKVKNTADELQKPRAQEALLNQMLLMDAKQSPADAPPSWLMEASSAYRRRQSLWSELIEQSWNEVLP